MNENEIQLAERARRGDQQAFGRLVEDHWNRLVRLSRSVVGPLAAEDTVQEALVTAWYKIHRLKSPEAFRAWITRIVFRRCLRWNRRQSFECSTESIAEGSEPERAETGIWVEQLLASLAPRQRAVLHLTIVEGYTDREIAVQLGITAASVRAHRRRARSRVQRLTGGGE